MADISKIKLPNGNTYNIKDTISGYTTNEGTITSVSADGTLVSNAGAANIPAATTSVPGVMTAADKTKLTNIETGAQKNVQSDWAQTDNTQDDYIKNKPTIANTLVTANATNRTLFITTEIVDGDVVSY